MKLGEPVELTETESGFRCRYMVEAAILTVQVQGKQVVMAIKDAETASYYWHTYSNLVVFFPCSRQHAQRLVDAHVGMYGSELVYTLAPLWEAWSNIPLAAASPSQQGGPTGALN